MSISEQSSATGLGRQAAFQNTLWSKVFAAGKSNGNGSHDALEELCRVYRQPIYVFLRRWGRDREEAHDLTQGFFSYVLQRKLISKADPDRGRFRNFLVGVLKNYMANQQERQNAIKRGGQEHVVSIDEETAEGLYAHEPANGLSPEKLFDRRWALTVLEEAMQRLRTEYIQSGMLDHFSAMESYLTGDQETGFAELGAKLKRSEGNARVMVCRLRNRFRQLIRAVIADTVADAEQVEHELKELQAALRG
jgi:RNA polymerase sigma factor (sigma-70 family)